MPRIARYVVFALAALLFFGLPSALTFYTDWLWFGETGYRQIFATSFGTRLLLGAVTFLVTFGWLLLNLRLALSSLRFAGPIVWTGQQGVQIELPSKQQLGRLAIGAAAIVALPAALYGASGWLTFLSWRNGAPLRVRRSGARLRRVVLRLHAAVHRVRARRIDGARGAGGARRGRRVCRFRWARPVSDGRRAAHARSAASPRAAGRCVPGAARGRRVARHPALPDDACRNRPRCVVYGRGGPLPRGTGARRGFAPGCRAGRRRGLSAG